MTKQSTQTSIALIQQDISNINKAIDEIKTDNKGYAKTSDLDDIKKSMEDKFKEMADNQNKAVFWRTINGFIIGICSVVGTWLVINFLQNR